MTSMKGLFINDNLTPYNVALLKELKHEKSRRSIDRLNSFHAAYSYQGKVFGKKLSSDMSSEAVWIKNPACLREFIQSLDGPSSQSSDNRNDGQQAQVNLD